MCQLVVDMDDEAIPEHVAAPLPAVSFLFCQAFLLSLKLGLRASLYQFPIKNYM